eukprot:68228_1
MIFQPTLNINTTKKKTYINISSQYYQNVNRKKKNDTYKKKNKNKIQCNKTTKVLNKRFILNRIRLRKNKLYKIVKQEKLHSLYNILPKEYHDYTSIKNINNCKKEKIRKYRHYNIVKNTKKKKMTIYNNRNQT